MRQVDINRGQNPPWNRQQMRRERKLRSLQAQLLHNLADVAMTERRVDREIIGHGDEVGLRSRLFPCSGDAGFGIGDNAALAVNHIGL